jgi:HEAT repeat protein
MLKYEESSIQKAVIEALGSIPKTRVAENLVPLLGNKDSNVRMNTIEALKRIGGPSVEPLINALYNDDVQIRTNAAMILGDIGDTLAVEPLIDTLMYKSGSSSIEPATLRLEAARALGKIRPARAVEPLIAALADKNYHVIERAAEALTAIGEESVGPLIKVLKLDNGKQTLAVMILGDIKDPRAVEPIIQTVLLASADNRSWNLRFEGTRALGKIKDPRAVDALEIMLGDRIACIREIAEWSLNEISGTTSHKKKDSFWNNLF